MTKIFISYSHKDKKWLDILVKKLNVLELQGFFTVWDDSKIKGGDDWHPAIEKALQEAHIAIMLVSDDFLTSPFIQKKEVPHILERRRKEGLFVIPVIVNPCSWDKVEWLNRIQVVPEGGKPLSTRKKHTIDTIMTNLANSIAERIKPKPKDPENISLPHKNKKTNVELGKEKKDKKTIFRIIINDLRVTLIISSLFFIIGAIIFLIIFSSISDNDPVHILSARIIGNQGTTYVVAPPMCPPERPCTGREMVRGVTLYADLNKNGYAAAYLQDQSGDYFNQEGRMFIRNSKSGSTRLWPEIPEHMANQDFKLWIVTSGQEIPTFLDRTALEELPKSSKSRKWGPIHLKFNRD